MDVWSFNKASMLKDIFGAMARGDHDDGRDGRGIHWEGGRSWWFTVGTGTASATHSLTDARCTNQASKMESKVFR